MDLLEFLRSHLGASTARQLAAHAGLTPEQAGNALNALWPLQLDALSTHAQLSAGGQQLLDLATSVPGGAIDTLLERPGSLDDLEKVGVSAAPVLLGSNADTINRQVASNLNVPSGAVTRLSHLSLPLLLKLLLEHARSNSLGAAGLGALLLSLRPQLGALLPVGLATLIGGFSAVKPTQAAQPIAAPNEERRRGAGWLWAIPLAALLLVGGYFLANQNRKASMETGASTSTDMAATNAFNVIEPQADTAVPAASFSMRGVGKAGQTVSIKEAGSEISTASVGQDGNWSAEIAAPTSGEHTYEVSSGSDTAQLRITAGAGNGSAAESSAAATSATTDQPQTGTAQTDTAASASTDPNAATDTATSTTPPANDAAATPPTINAPSGKVAGAFDLTGSGVAGQTVTVLEDGANIGAATVGSDGTWTLNVPSPAAGEHKYQVSSEGGQATTDVTVGAATGDAAACTQAFTLSLTDGQSVSSPFRFGGQGSGAGYTVAVKRGERVVGTKALPVSGSCGWSYSSNPGKGEITYVVRSGKDLTSTPISTITLNVQ
ncbi:hypothetical protein EHF33_04565 [Deinococcus psychrotolerans]|uniref:Bacterial Ig domain-containing protein n=1 Tax=Deinococcus psychrotolerans TaxID=2489213 RepID=A0A3G8YLU5_9DEIO|nr:DUF937 domain-containing protein [Deinococcus psychrotolerans]AZI42106.1 hypothetical protein EHF33_04565 [Deinococcus psychrotolerans]